MGTGLTASLLDATMAGVELFVIGEVHALEIMCFGGGKVISNRLVEVALVVLEGQDVITLLRLDSFGYGSLAAHGVDGHHCAFEFQLVQELRDCGDFIGFNLGGHLPQCYPCLGGPGAYQMQR